MKTNLNQAERKTTMHYPQRLRVRITAAFMAVFMLAQICMPTVAVAAILLSDDKITGEVMSDVQMQPSTTSEYLYQKATYFDQVGTIQNQTIGGFLKTLIANKVALPAPTLVPIFGDITIFVPSYPLGKLLGDSYVQNRIIRQQINDLLGRHLIDTALYPTEEVQNNRLYDSALTFAKAQGNPYKFGQKLPSSLTISQDMIWPEVRTINGEKVLVPIVYLSDNTLSKYGVQGHLVEFSGTTVFANIDIDKSTLIARRDALIAATNNINNNGGTIVGADSLKLFAGGTLTNLSGRITAAQNLEITAGQIHNKTIVVPYTFKNGTGTRLGEIASIDAGGNISLQSYNDIVFEGAVANANGTITFNASNNIIIGTQSIQSQSTGTDGHWQLTNSTVDVVGSKITANDTIRLVAGGAIQISGSEIHSTKGGIELLAKQGVYILDALGQTLVQKVDKIGKTRGTASDFNSWAIRSALDAGKGVLLYTEGGDVTLKGADITSVAGTQVTAKNGKVHLLLSKEQSQHYLNTVKKGSWTIKTKTVEQVIETGKPNAIVGGFAVEAMHGIDIEYTGKEGITIVEQIEEYRKMPSMKWMVDLYDQNKHNIDWNQVELEYKNINKTSRQLSPAAMAIIAIAICVATGGAGGALAGSINATVSTAVGGGAFGAIAGAAAVAGAMTLTTSAAQSLAAGNSLGDTINAMDSDENLKSLAISMVTAGAMKGLGVESLELVETPAGAAVNPALDLVNQSYQAVVSSAVRAGVSVTINGGNSEDYFKSFQTNLALYVVETLGEKMAKAIGDAYANGSAEGISNSLRYIAHAGAGCVYGVASGAASSSEGSEKYSCFSGAGGAVIGELVADQFKDYHDIAERQQATEEWLTLNGIDATTNYDAMTPEQKELLRNTQPANFIPAAELHELQKTGVDLAKLGAGLAAFIAEADVNIAATAGENAAANNALPLVVYAAMLSLSAISAYLMVQDTIEFGEKITDPNLSEQEKQALIVKYAKDLGVDIAITVAGVGALKGIRVLVDHLKREGKVSADAIKELERIDAAATKGESYKADTTESLTDVTKQLPPLRQAYVDEVMQLRDAASRMHEAGKTPEEIARALHQLRRDLGVKYKDLSPPVELEKYYARNLEKYGDRLGPTIDWLVARGKTWEDIIASASKPGGTDLGF